jgi:antitoxin component YwqK of YwqJK toxin-antitoxin module
MEKKLNQHDAEGKRHGLWEDYYEDGTLWQRRHYHHDQMHGLWEIYYRDGTLWGKGHCHHDRLKGIVKWWNPQGGISTKRYNLLLR